MGGNGCGFAGFLSEINTKCFALKWTINVEVRGYDEMLIISRLMEVWLAELLLIV